MITYIQSLSFVGLTVSEMAADSLCTMTCLFKVLAQLGLVGIG